MELNYYPYLAEKGYQLKPVWVFHIKETYEDDFGQEDSEYGYRMVNAISGNNSSSLLRSTKVISMIQNLLNKKAGAILAPAFLSYFLLVKC